MVMSSVSQGDILRLEKGRFEILVLSKDFFNRSGMIIACPIVKNAPPDALHIPVCTDHFHGTACLEQLKGIDIQTRFYTRIGRIPFVQIQDIADAVQSIFDYYPYSQLD